MYSANHVSLWLRATANAPPRLSQETIIIIVVSASVAGIILFYALYRIFLSCFSSSNAVPLPPVQPLAHHRSQRARMQADLTYSSSFLSPPSTFPTLSSSNGSKTSLLDSELGEEQPGTNLPCKESQLSPASSSSMQSIQPVDQRKVSSSSSRTRSVSSLRTSASRRTRRSTVYGTPHSPFSRVQIILPAPLAAGSRQSISPDSRYGHPEPPSMRRARTPSYVDQWVTPVAPEPDFSIYWFTCLLYPGSQRRDDRDDEDNYTTDIQLSHSSTPLDLDLELVQYASLCHASIYSITLSFQSSDMGKSSKRTKKPVIEDDEVYHVEVITKARVTAASDSSSASEGEGSVSDILRKKKKKNNSEAKWEYYVKWAGYDSDANSWEPEENVADCQRLLSSFWEHIGMDNEDYPVGYVISADEGWIKKEKKFFKKEYKGLQEKMKQQKNEKQLENKSKKSNPSFSRSASASSSTKGKQKADIELTSSDSDDDQPLSELVPGKRKANFLSDGEKSAPPIKTQKTDSSRKVTLQDPLPPESNTSLVESLFTPSPEGLSVPKPLPQQPKVHPIPLPRLKKPPVILKLKRPLNQHSNIAAGTVDPASLSSNSALSTKQRLAPLALSPMLPKNALQSPVVEVDRRRKHAIKEISFKKNPQSTPTIASPVTLSTTSQAIADSSVSNDSMLLPSLSRGARPSIDWRRRSSSQYENRQIEATPMEVDDFLSSMMPEALAAPLTASPQIEQGPLPPKLLINRTQPPPIKIQKKWKWSGLFMLEQADGHTESFNVNIQDCTEPVPTGLRFSIVMNETDRLVARSFHDIVDVGIFLRACQPAAHLGRMVLQDSQDAQPTAAFSTLTLYMAKRKQVIFIPALFEQDIVGHMLLFAPEKDLNQKLNVPQELCRAQSLVVALLPWELTATQIAMDWRKPISLALPQNMSMEPMTSDTARWERSIRSKPFYHHALRILRFPKDLIDFMVRELGRPYIVWHDGGDNTNIRNYPGFETLCLESVMDQCRAGLARLTSVPTRVVFIHVGALTTVHKIPQLSERRGKHPSVQFYTYGTHESVVPEVWGIHEIWPCGGVITFTPQSALEDFFGLLHRIQQAHTHPLWTCYVLPSVIGMIAKLVCGNEDPIAVYDRGEFVFKELLEAIVSGELAMITSPRADQCPISASNLSQQWLDEFALSSLDTEKVVLQHAIDSFKAKYSNIQAPEWTRVITEEIAVDLAHMQRHPAIMKDYRRYVVLRGDQHEALMPEDGFERVTISDFDFSDEFYPKQ